MIHDANTFDRGTIDLPFDVCIAGAGFAGIALALALADRGFSVALLEAGGEDLDPKTQDPYLGEIVGLDYFDPYITRMRHLGGGSNHWAGRCRALDAHDFEPRPHHSLTGWPITQADLDPYAAATDSFLGLPPEEVRPDRPLDWEDGLVREIRYRYSRPPKRLGEAYADRLAADPRITSVLHANLVDLKLDEDLRRVTTAVFRSYVPDDPGFAIRARHFCLCLGGLENPRFLLNARSQIPTGIGNEHDLVGRFFCDHPHFKIADIMFENAVPQPAHYAPAPAFLDEAKVLPFSVWLDTDRLDLAREAARGAICAAPFTERLAERVLGWTVDCGYGGLRDALGQAWQGADPLGRLYVNSCQALNPDSRVRLIEERDDFGLNRLAIDWRLTELDYHTMRTAALFYGAYAAEQGIGRVRLVPWLQEEALPPGPGEDGVGGHHHMCTTRMSDDPREGVVDRNCLVHGMENLFIGGSSVFSSGGHANPSYTIVQLSLRLADHLAAEAQSPSG